MQELGQFNPDYLAAREYWGEGTGKEAGPLGARSPENLVPQGVGVLQADII